MAIGVGSGSCSSGSTGKTSGVSLVSYSGANVNPNDEWKPLHIPFGELNPDPRKFKIEKFKRVGHFACILAKYEQATNFNGYKIMVYKVSSSCPEYWLRERFKNETGLDPHFLEEGLCPIARFKPDKEGWRIAIHFCKAMMCYEKEKS